MRPRRSKTAFARSPASRTIGEKADRCSARACSFTVDMRDCQRISSSMGSKVACGVSVAVMAASSLPSGFRQRRPLLTNQGG